MNVDLPPDRPATLPAYVNIRQPDIYAEPKARLHRGRDGQPDIAVVYLADELDMHVRTAAQARALAAAFTSAAEQLAAAEAPALTGEAQEGRNLTTAQGPAEAEGGQS